MKGLTLAGLVKAQQDLDGLYLSNLELRFHPVSESLPILQDLFALYSIQDLEVLHVRVVHDYRMRPGMIWLGELENFSATGRIGSKNVKVFDVRENT